MTVTETQVDATPTAPQLVLEASGAEELLARLQGAAAGAPLSEVPAHV
jgi:hypothetical protein